jgi:enolase
MKFSRVRFERAKIPNGVTVKCALKVGRETTSAVPPYGTSAGAHEINPFSKNGLNKAMLAFPKLKGKEFNSLKELEEEILKHDDGKFNKIGGNLVLALSVAFLRMKAKLEGKELYELFRAKKIPNPLGKVVGGGKHAPKGPDFQEFLAYSKKPFEKAVELNKSFHRRAGQIFKSRQLDLEGGWVVKFDEEKVLNRLADLRDDSFPEILLGLDVAASSFYNKGKYVYKGKNLSGKAQFDFVLELIKKYKLFYVEDPFHEEDFKSFAELQLKAKKCLVCGDDLLVTNPDRLWRAISKNSCRAAIVKPNQIGLLSRMFEFVSECKKNGVEPVFSHRSKESYDDYLADMSVGTKIIKMGIRGKERETKLKRLRVISESSS